MWLQLRGGLLKCVRLQCKPSSIITCSSCEIRLIECKWCCQKTENACNYNMQVIEHHRWRVLTQFCMSDINGRQIEIRLRCAESIKRPWRRKSACFRRKKNKNTCKDGLSGMSDFPPSDCSGRQVSLCCVRTMVRRQRAQGCRGGQTPGRRLLMWSRARASSPDTGALARTLAHREGLQQWGHCGLFFGVGGFPEFSHRGDG